MIFFQEMLICNNFVVGIEWRLKVTRSFRYLQSIDNSRKRLVRDPARQKRSFRRNNTLSFFLIRKKLSFLNTSFSFLSLGIERVFFVVRVCFRCTGSTIRFRVKRKEENYSAVVMLNRNSSFSRCFCLGVCV